MLCSPAIRICRAELWPWQRTWAGVGNTQWCWLIVQAQCREGCSLIQAVPRTGETLRIGPLGEPCWSVSQKDSWTKGTLTLWEREGGRASLWLAVQVWILLWVCCSTEREILSLSTGTCLLVNKKHCSKQRWLMVTEKFRNWVESFILPWSQLPIMSVGSDFFQTNGRCTLIQTCNCTPISPSRDCGFISNAARFIYKRYSTLTNAPLCCYLEQAETWSQWIRQNGRGILSLCLPKWRDFWLKLLMSFYQHTSEDFIQKSW